MNALNLTLSSSSSSSLLQCFCSITENGKHQHHLLQWKHHLRNPRNTNHPSSSSSSQYNVISSYLRRPRNSKQKPTKKTNHPFDQRYEFVIDVEDVANRASSSLRRFWSRSEAKFNRFVSSGMEAYDDLKTIVTVDRDRRVVIGCRRSSLDFLANFILWSILIVVAVRVLFKSGVLGFRGGFGGPLVWRRDRSLAGREVVVGRSSFKEREGRRKKDYYSYSPARDMMTTESTSAAFRPRRRVASEEKLPKWWPVMLPSSPAPTIYKESQREANAVIQAILDNRMSGGDITEDDIIQFRQICRKSGAKVFIEMVNARDSLYRASVEFVLNTCSSSENNDSIVLVYGEDAPHFVAGLASNIGLESIRAARIVSATVAARTRSWFLQAWALEMQGKRTEVEDELLKISRVHQIFPPEESSPEMEMVARGLEKHLRMEQRKFLFNLFVQKCGTGCQRSAAEALGLKRCSLENNASIALVYGENAPHFVAGLASNVGLESIRAARIVSATVAARTRSWFLQAWVGSPVSP